jgi:hypothetical protein
MKLFFRLVIICVLFQSCCKEEMPPPIPPCEHDDFHVTYRFNDSCVTETFVQFSKDGEDFAIKSGRTHSEEIAQFLNILILEESNLNDTLWIEGFDVTSSFTDRVIFTYSYVESSGISGGFRIRPGQGTKDDYLIIDYYNADTTILEGRFQCKFKEGSAASWVNAPDSLKLSEGSFKVMME